MPADGAWPTLWEIHAAQLDQADQVDQSKYHGEYFREADSDDRQLWCLNGTKRVWVPPFWGALQLRLIVIAHAAVAHGGIKATLQVLATRFSWSHMREDRGAHPA